MGLGFAHCSLCLHHLSCNSVVGRLLRSLGYLQTSACTCKGFYSFALQLLIGICCCIVTFHGPKLTDFNTTICVAFTHFGDMERVNALCKTTADVQRSGSLRSSMLMSGYRMRFLEIRRRIRFLLRPQQLFLVFVLGQTYRCNVAELLMHVADEKV